MRIVYLIDSLASGGAQRQIVELARHLARAPDLDVHVVAYHSLDFFAARLRSAGVSLSIVPKYHRFDPTFPSRLSRHLRTLGPDILHSFLLAPSLWAFLSTRLWPKGTRPFFVAAERSDPTTRARLGQLTQRLVYSNCDAVTVNSHKAAQALRDRLGVPAAHIHFVGNGIDLTEWRHLGAKDCPLPINPRQFNLALIGGLRPVKNHRLVLDALECLGPAKTKNWRIWFIGGETGGRDAASSVKEEIEKRRLCDRVTISEPTQNVAAVMGKLDGLLLASLHEGFPNAVLEGMASGVPVVATNVGEVPRMLENMVSGLIVDEPEPGRFGGAMRTLYEMTEVQRDTLGRRAKQVVETRYSLPIVANDYLELYRSQGQNTMTYRDEWKKDAPGHGDLQKLHENLREQISAKYKRGLPFCDELFDRWERAAHLGFGENSSIYDASLVFGDVTVGEHTWIGPFTILDGSGGLSVGAHCSISAGVQIYSHDTVHWSLSGGKAPTRQAPVSIGDCTYIGPNTIIASGVSIGSHCVVGAGSFVNRSVEANSIVFGSPAKLRGKVEIDGDEVRMTYLEKE